MHETIETKPLHRRSRAFAIRQSEWTRVGVVVCATFAVSACRLGGLALPGGDTSRAHTLVTSIRAEPRSFNRYIARDLSTEVVALLTHASLVRVDREIGRASGRERM